MQHTTEISAKPNWLFEKMNKIDKPLARLLKKTDKAKVNNI